MADQLSGSETSSQAVIKNEQKLQVSTYGEEESQLSFTDSKSNSSSVTLTCDAEIAGWRYWGTMAGLYLGLFIVTLDMTIVNTALVAIANDLGDFSHTTWIINAYAVSWTGCLILWSQFSHSMGRKPSLLVAVVCFTMFSMGCALAQTSVQLIVLRAAQGFFGAGVVQIPTVLIPEVVPTASFPKYIAFMSLVSAISFTVGPLVGGAIAAHTTWRWVFWINLPIGAIIFLTDVLSIPQGVPYQRKPKQERPKVRLNSFKSLDLVGAALFICASVLLVTALQEAGSALSWNSAFVICFLVISAVSWIGFVAWERWITLSASSVNPLMTWRFFHRKSMAMFICSALVWVPFTTTLIQIPLQYQIIEGVSPERAGILLLPYILLVPVGSALASLLSGKYKFNITAGLLIGAVIQAIAGIGFATRSTQAAAEGYIPRSQFAFQVLMGFGTGMTYAFNFNSVPFVLSKQMDLVATAMGVLSQLRYFGGALGLGVITAALNTTLRSHLAAILSPAEVNAILHSSSSIQTLDSMLQQQTRVVFADGFLLQWRIVCGFIGLEILTILFTV